MKHRIPDLPRPLLAALASFALLGLSACGTDPAQPADEAAAAATPAAAGPATPAAGATGVQEQLTTNCPGPEDGRVHFRVGDAVFAVPPERIGTVVPPNVTAGTDTAEVVRLLRTATEGGAGCPNQPLEAGLLSIAVPGADPLLAGQIGIVRSQAGAIAGPYAELTRNLLQNRDRCQQMEGGLIACAGAETVGEQQRPVMYVVSTEQGRTLSFGGPLAARCSLQDNQVRSCEVIDELAGNIGIEAPLRALPQSTQALASAHRAAVQAVESVRR